MWGFCSVRLQNTYYILNDGYSMVVILMWLWEEGSTAFTYFVILTEILICFFNILLFLSINPAACTEDGTSIQYHGLLSSLSYHKS